MLRTKSFLIVLAALAALLSSCDHNVTSETTVHADGKIDKVFVFENSDSVKNIVGLHAGNGWHKTVHKQNVGDGKGKSDKFVSTYAKSFASVGDVNQELAIYNDSLLRITSTFEKNFRWFYTHIRYSETIHTLNNLRLKPEDYLVQEDYSFIDRLPAEGKPLSKGDAFYLSELNTRIYDKYGARAFFEEYCDLANTILKEQQLNSKWIDTLAVHKEDLFRRVQAAKDIPEDFISNALDSLGVPIKKDSFDVSFKLKLKALERRTNFISSASEGKYKYIVHLPWQLVESNADSVAGNTVVWSPPSIRFLLRDYTMYSECRKPNYIMWVICGAIVLFTGYLFMRRRSAVAK